MHPRAAACSRAVRAASLRLGASSRSPARLVCRPRAPQPGPVGQLGRLSETVVAFAGAGRASTETVVAFAGAGRASTETAIAFAGAKWVFLVHFSGAEAMPVSRLPCWGRAVVMVVSMVAVQGRAVVLLVSTSPRCRASCVKKFALHAHIGPKWAFSGVLGELFRGNVAEGGVLGEFFADRQAWDPTGRVCCNAVLAAGPSTGSVNPSMRSYTHRVEAGRGRPTTPATDPVTQSVDKGKWLSGQGCDKP